MENMEQVEHIQTVIGDLAEAEGFFGLGQGGGDAQAIGHVLDVIEQARWSSDQSEAFELGAYTALLAGRSLCPYQAAMAAAEQLIVWMDPTDDGDKEDPR